MSGRLDAASLTAPLAALQAPAWVVGGGLRDALMGRPVADLDVVTQGDAAAEAAALARAHGAARFPLSREFGAWRVSGGGLPCQVDIMPVLGDGLDDDLSRRDFTINALALAVGGDGQVIDRHGGVADIGAGRMALVSPSALADDAVRVLRLARIADALGFGMDPAAVTAARAAAPALAEVPGERAMEEFTRIITAPDPGRSVRLLDELGGLGGLIPELDDCRGVDQSEYHHLDVLGHTFEVLDNVVAIERDPERVFRGAAPVVAASLAEPLADDLTRGQALRFTALLHDMAKAETRGVMDTGRITFIGHDRRGADMADAWFRRLRTSNRLREFVVHGVRDHLVLGFMVHRQPLTLVQYDRYLRRVAPYPVEAIVLSAADRIATDGPRTTPIQITRHLALARDMLDAHVAITAMDPIRPPLDGAELTALLGREPGPWLADLLIATREEQLMGRVHDALTAERFARAWAADHLPRT
ncbi:MAG: HD domain-containing protein [Actinomycetota bacterium]